MSFWGAGPQFLPKIQAAQGAGQGPLQRFYQTPCPASRSSCLCGWLDSRHVRADKGLLTDTIGLVSRPRVWHVMWVPGRKQAGREPWHQGMRSREGLFWNGVPRFCVQWEASFLLERLWEDTVPNAMVLHVAGTRCVLSFNDSKR